MTFMEPFRDKIAIVTGGASGIGRELCQQLQARGAAAVVVADLNPKGAQQTADRIVAAGGLSVGPEQHLGLPKHHKIGRD
jgi:NAD(P)-dependent dehydrogenase (short-subunit alcohol dehydrogenase family)